MRALLSQTVLSAGDAASLLAYQQRASPDQDAFLLDQFDLRPSDVPENELELVPPPDDRSADDIAGALAPITSEGTPSWSAPDPGQQCPFSVESDVIHHSKLGH